MRSRPRSSRRREAASGGNRYLVWLDWPEKCFRACDGDIALLRSLVPSGAEIVRVRGERAFLRELPRATHAIVWNFRPEWFAAAKRLRVLATPAAGMEFVPSKGPKGVKIHFGGFQGPMIAETVAAFALAWKRGFFRPELGKSQWPRNELSGVCGEVAGTKAVIVGYGRIGKAIGAKLRSLGVSVSGVTRHGVFEGSRRIAPPGDLGLDRLSSADWCILALPSTTGTDNWLDSGKMARMPRRCVVVNVGRGNSIDEAALFAALKSGRIAGAYLDVRKREPSATVLDSPGYVPELSSLPNCIQTPHSSAFSPRYIGRCFSELAKKGLLS